MTTQAHQRRVRRGARRLLLALEPAMRGHGLAVRAWRAWEWVLTAANRRHEKDQGEDGYPLPPVSLRIRVIARGDSELFFSTGRSDAAAITEACAQNGVAIADVGRLLDFGCGCGRVSRHWAPYSSVEVHGADHDPDLISWIASGLPFVHARRTGLAPPLPYPDNHFGLVYAISVFTHMTAELAPPWIAELERIIEPDGLLLITALDHRQVDRLRPHEREAFNRGEPVVQFEDALGTNMCVSYHPRAYIEAITPNFDLLSTTVMGAQKLYVLRMKSHQPQAR